MYVWVRVCVCVRARASVSMYISKFTNIFVIPSIHEFRTIKYNALSEGSLYCDNSFQLEKYLLPILEKNY